MLLGISVKFQSVAGPSRGFLSISSCLFQLRLDATRACQAVSSSGIPISSWDSVGRSSGWTRRRFGRCPWTSWCYLARASGGSTRWVAPWWAERAVDSCRCQKGVSASRKSRSACTDVQTLCKWATLCLVVWWFGGVDGSGIRASFAYK
jgi:hypothetical protein